MSRSPRVSVVIVNWNTRDLLGQTLTSLHEATHGVSFETIVVDNGSTDGSTDKVQTEWPAVRLVELPENRGFAAANNAGFRLAGGEYVLLLNSDTIVLPTTVPELVAALDENNRAGCVGARHLNPDLSLQRSMDNAPSISHDFMFFCLNDLINLLNLSRFRRVRGWLTHHSLWWSDHDEIASAGWVNGACMMVRRQVMDHVGVLDESFFIYGEEVDWCTRMRAAGWEILFIPAAEVIHIGGQAMNQVTDRRVYLKYLGMLKYYRKNLPNQVFWFLLMVKAIAAVRIMLIIVLAILNRLGVRIAPRTWRLVTQEVVPVAHATIIRAWWQIFKLS